MNVKEIAWTAAVCAATLFLAWRIKAVRTNVL